MKTEPINSSLWDGLGADAVTQCVRLLVSSVDHSRNTTQG